MRAASKPQNADCQGAADLVIEAAVLRHLTASLVQRAGENRSDLDAFRLKR
jgi:hypothetical protein